MKIISLFGKVSKKIAVAILLVAVVALAAPAGPALATSQPIAISSATVNGGSTTTIASSGTINVSVGVHVTGNTDWRSTRYQIGTSGWTCVDTTDFTSGNDFTTSFSVNGPATSGTRNFDVQVFEQSNCSGTVTNSLTLTNAIVTSVVDVTAPVITVTGTNPVNVLYGATYTDAGATIDDSSTIVTNNTVNTSAIGAYTVTYNATDTAGNVATQKTRTVNVVAVPLTITANNQTKVAGNIFTFAGSEFGLTGLLGGDSVTGVTLTSTGTGAEATVGDYVIAISNALGTGLSHYQISYVNGTLTVTPIPDTTAPVITVPEDITAQATSPAGAVVTFSATSDDESEVICTPASESTFSIGTTLVTCTATDESENTGTASFNVVVSPELIPAPNVPTLSDIGDQSVTLGDTATFDADATDADGHDVLTFTLAQAETDAATIDSETGMFSWDTTGTTLDAHTFTVTVSDGNSNTDSETFTITVTETPVIDETAPTCPDDMTLILEGEVGVCVDTTPSAPDACSVGFHIDGDACVSDDPEITETSTPICAEGLESTEAGCIVPDHEPLCGEGFGLSDDHKSCVVGGETTTTETETESSGHHDNSVTNRFKEASKAAKAAKNAPAGEVLGAEDFQFQNNLHWGMTLSPDVMELQKRLRKEGFFTYPEETGYFGPFTFAAVKAYQSAHPSIGYVTGYFGPLTRAEINAH